jgi:N-acetylglutamate synthase-like GNAT family acetyltransferase
MSGVDCWAIAQDAAAVHFLLELSDARSARPGSPPPKRNVASTRRHVSNGWVRMLERDGRFIGMFTLSPEAPFDESDAGYSLVQRPLYLQRLAIHPECDDPLLGLRLLRRAVAIARASEAEVLRAETNPHLAEVCAMMAQLGFETVSERTSSETPARYVQLRFRI